MRMSQCRIMEYASGKLILIIKEVLTQKSDQVFVQVLISGLGPHLQKAIELGIN